MAQPIHSLDELRHAYRVLDAPASSTAHLIRQRHRQLLKRWHPDLYQEGSAQHAEATQMSKVINDAYSKIRFAPLRYVPNPGPLRADAVANPGPFRSDTEPDENYPRLDRIEFWVRFVCGALFGLFIGAKIGLELYTDQLSPVVIGIVCTGVVVACVFVSAKWGDKFWYAILQRWWL